MFPPEDVSTDFETRDGAAYYHRTNDGGYLRGVRAGTDDRDHMARVHRRLGCSSCVREPCDTALMPLRATATFLVCALAIACTDDREEQPAFVDPNAFTLGPGFAPDPQVKTGMAGGPVEASQRQTDCRGWISPQPNHTLVLSAPFPQLRIVIHSTGDPTLVVALADGTYRCNDDSEDLNSMVEGSFPAGTHQIFVGTYGSGPPAPYSIGVSQGLTLLPSTIAGHAVVPPPTPPTPPPVPAPPRLAPPGAPSGPQPPVVLAPGFGPDPQVQTSWAGGTVQASTLGDGCNGYIPSVPQHSLVLRRPLESFRVLVSSGIDTTLRIRGPAGTVRCNDDSDGVNPAVAGTFAAGTHQVFVGTYGPGQGGPYRIGFTTRPELTAAELAAMEAPDGIVGPRTTPPVAPMPPPVIPAPPSPGTERRVPGMMPGDMNPQGLTAAQRAAADASGISYYEARELYRCRTCMLEHDFDHCIFMCREPCLDCVSAGTPTERVCGPPCGGRR